MKRKAAYDHIQRQRQRQRENNMESTLKQVEEALSKNSVPTAMADVFDEIPSYQETNSAIKGLRAHHRDLARWVNKEVENERARISRERSAFLAKRQKRATAVFDGLAMFGIEPKGSTVDDYETAWDRVAEGLDRKQRDDQLLGRTHESNTGVATMDPAVTDARLLRDAIDAVRDLDARIATVEARIEAVDPYDIDERTVGLLKEFAGMGLSPDPDGDGRPVMDTELRSRAEKLGILGGEGPVM